MHPLGCIVGLCNWNTSDPELIGTIGFLTEAHWHPKNGKL